MSNALAKILKNKNFLSLANNGLVAVFGFFGFLLLVRSLSTNEFGEWVLLITTANFLDMLRFGITRTAIVRFLAGAEEKEARQLIGSNWVINFFSTFIIVLIVLGVRYYFYDAVTQSGFALFFKWFPILAFINLPFNNAQSVLQAKMRFDYMLILRIINVGLFMFFLLVNYFFLHVSLTTIVYAYLIINVLTSLVAIIPNWDGFRFIMQATRETNKKILNFGKYSTGTLIGSNLLKSADTFIIGLSPFLGTAGVALYSIPLKLTEIIEIPLRSFAMTAFPGMSKASIEGNKDLVKHIFYTNAGGMTLLMVPVMLISFIFAKDFVYILGGPGYESTTGVFRIFTIYGLLLPLDRFIGVALDSVNMPRYNFLKVVYMAVANIIGDTLVVFAFYYVVMATSLITLFALPVQSLHQIVSVTRHFTMITTLEGVAFVTISFTLIGIFVGYHYLNKSFDIHLRKVLQGGILFFSESIFRKRR
ncbi:oligosaccharide flippase family protein [Candidatus Sulfidibacterium hydrothermale]|uniref:lipopolysaccharide biosynthesis protein n=1 Tax=Candidatus Sulfidibacterium hydrothermale TaxID=2875962 RepID=UPI001F0AD62E|nr:oligosaccharide flippase family protein [Candidatus Sulfidibacterium hydrothermale]UBM63583.1 oligosaccharide flippase family protein [Candidatus Sulfidibacterium hydrothermale]